MMHGKAIWKLGIAEIAKASKDFVRGPHKTQSFLKNGGQQKWLDKKPWVMCHQAVIA